MKTHFKKNGGFTLVELIVVIAILAILAAVAVPAYSGYIEKANRAGDETLLAAVNRAFTSACLDNGVDPYSLNQVTALLVYKEGTTTIDPDQIHPVEIRQSFKLYFAGNENAEFKVMKKPVYVSVMGMFVAPDAEGKVPVTYAGVTLNISQELIGMVDASTFMTAATLGSDELLEKIDATILVTQGLVGTGGPADNLISNVIGDPKFQKEMTGYLGVGNNLDEINKKQAELAQKMVDAGLAPDLETAKQQVAMNGAVIYAAQNTAQMTTTDAMAFLTGNDVKMSITDIINDNSTQALSNATLAYGMYTAFAHSSMGTDAAKGYNADDAMDHLNDEDFQAYLKTDTAKKDLEAYLAALSIINSTTQEPGALEDVLVNGYGNDDLKNAVGGLFGNQ